MTFLWQHGSSKSTKKQDIFQDQESSCYYRLPKDLFFLLEILLKSFRITTFRPFCSRSFRFIGYTSLSVKYSICNFHSCCRPLRRGIFKLCVDIIGQYTSRNLYALTLDNAIYSIITFILFLYYMAGIVIRLTNILYIHI